MVLATVESAGPVPPARARHGAPRSCAPTRARRPGAGSGGPAGERHQVQADGETYHLYWGDLHRHSLVSRCTSGDEPSLEDFYRYAWDVNEYDFWAVTDHAENSTAYQWWSIQKIADLLHVPGRFVPFYGFEWTSAEQRPPERHLRRRRPRRADLLRVRRGQHHPDGLWRGLAEHPEFPAITIPHHPGSAMVHNDWDYHDPRYSRLVEVFQACRGNYESQVCFRQYSDGTATGTFMIDGLRRGHRFGLIASSDHGHGASYVAVLARSLSRADIFDGAAVPPHLCGDHPRRAGRSAAGPAPHGFRRRVDRSAAAAGARPRLRRAGPRRHPARRRGRPHRPGRAGAGARAPPRRPAGGVGQGGEDHALGRSADRVGGGRLVLPELVGPEVAAMDDRRWRGSTPRTASASPTAPSGAASRSACAGPAPPRCRSSARAGRSGSGWPSWPTGWPRVLHARASGPGADGPGDCRCSRPSVPCSVWAYASST